MPIPNVQNRTDTPKKGTARLAVLIIELAKRAASSGEATKICKSRFGWPYNGTEAANKV